MASVSVALQQTSLLLLLCVVASLEGTTVKFSVMEEVPSGTRIGDVRHEADLYTEYPAAQVESFEYRPLDANSKGAQLFTVTNSSGVLRTRDTLDREQICPGQSTCEVKLEVVYTAADVFNVINVVVEVTDINDNAPTFPQKSVTLVIPESASIGATYNLPLAQDPDIGEFSVKSYVLQSRVPHFDLKIIRIGNTDIITTLQLELKQTLDREATPFYQVVVVATDGGETPKSGSLKINITVADANDHGPSFSNETYQVKVPEDQAVGSRVLRLQATDADIGDNGRIIYQLVSGAADSSLGIFEVVKNTGEIMLTKKLDYESKQSYHIIVEARDGGDNSQPAFANVMIDVEDINNNAPQISVNTQNATSDVAYVSELVDAGKFVAHISVRDPDTGDGGIFDCDIDDRHFRLQKIQEGQYKVVTRTKLDHEERAQYQVRITCADQGDPQLVSEKTVLVRIKDENDNAPMFSRSTFSVTFTENNYLNQYITQVNATDLDMGVNAALTYELGLEGRDMFNIDPRTGVIRAGGVFDYEKEKMYIFPVVAKDGGKPQRSGSALVSVTITDKNDEAPTFNKAAYIFDVLENQPVGMEIGILSATDSDSDAFNYFEYALVHSAAAEHFAVDKNTGHVRTRRVLDREQQAVYHMVATASNVGLSPLLSGSALLTINVLDENDHAPVIDYPNEHNYTVQMSTHVPEGYLVGLVQAHDRDTGNNARLSYAITDGNNDGAFTIDPTLGAVSTRRSLSHMSNKLYDMKITVYDHGFPARYTTVTLHVLLNASIAYPHGMNPAKLLSGTNVTIVISLAVASAIVVIALVIAIVVIRRKEVNKRKRNPVYRCQIEANKTPPTMENINEKTMNGQVKPSAGRGNSNPNANNGGLGKGNKKEVSFNMNMKDSYGLSNNGKPINTDKPDCNQLLSSPIGKSKSEVVPSRPCDSNRKENAPSTASGRPHGPEFPGGEAAAGSGSATCSQGELIALPPQHKPWEIDAGLLQTQYMMENGGGGEDSDSAYSGDVSNTDSGRGPSEEGEVTAQGIPFYTPASGKAPQGAAPLSQAHVDTLRLHKPQHQSSNNSLYPAPPPQHGGSRYPSEPHRHQAKLLNTSNPHSSSGNASKGRQSDVARPPSRSAATPQGKPLPPPRKSSAKDDMPTGGPGGHHGYPAHHHPHHHHPGHGYHDNWRVNNNNQWGTLPEVDDDGESSTSGSYIVDPSDLYMDGRQPAVMV